ncbi:MAG TPA: cytochrome c [Aestuariivirga sp.]|nr:cytochrome c [Alphaproteobacteria bacterium]HRX37741.1 cytochrome c [Aestuariivirga sp.]
MDRRLISVIAAPMLVLAAGQPAMAGDAAKGHDLAKERCARCHAVEKGEGFKQRPPSFQSIAIYRREDDIWARILSPSPHSGMPEAQWSLTPEQVQDLVAYIVSLDTPVSLPAQ